LACKFALAAAVLARIPGVVATQQLFFDIAFTRATVIQLRGLARGIDRYLAVSQHTADRMEGDLGLPADRVQVVPNAVDVDAFDAAPARPIGDQWRDDRPVVLCAARLHEQKGHRYLLDAIPDVPNASFIFAGEGPERNALEAQSRALDISERVVFLGARSDVPALLQSCDVFVLPSLYEGLPLAVLEAMASRKPVVATRIGGTDEAVVDGETGFLVPARNPPALAAALNALLEDPDRARAMGAAGRVRVERRFSSKRIAAGVAAVYEEALRSRDG
jgi:glycosyltransferase involved in cell wall biosynthesis